MDQQEPLMNLHCNQLEVKLDIYHKRPNSLQFRQWTRCSLNVEAIKCLPCFLRITITSLPNRGIEDDSNPNSDSKTNTNSNPDLNSVGNSDTLDASLVVSINVHEIVVNLATSRTKTHAYGLFWTHNRRKCYLYFALETESECRKHMKWFRKVIKFLEVYRYALLEHRRNSRGNVMRSHTINNGNSSKRREVTVPNSDGTAATSSQVAVRNTDGTRSSTNDNIQAHISYISAIYEEIKEGNLSSRLSHASVASGIYEEMKHEEEGETAVVPPPLPPIPSQRQRINTFNNRTDLLSDISSQFDANSDTETSKTKRSRNILNNLFLRSIRHREIKSAQQQQQQGESFKEHSKDCLLTEKSPASGKLNNMKMFLERVPPSSQIHFNSRLSFSSPDLSKINLLMESNEERCKSGEMENDSVSDKEETENEKEKNRSIEENKLTMITDILEKKMKITSKNKLLLKHSESLESMNMSECLPMDFNFSACNNSYVNLIGSNGAVPSIGKAGKASKLIIHDELNGYCAMAPIKTDQRERTGSGNSLRKDLIMGTNVTLRENCFRSPISSGYSTASGGSMDIHANVGEKGQRFNTRNAVESCEVDSVQKVINEFYDSLPKRKNPIPVTAPIQEESIVYENMLEGQSPTSFSDEGKALQKSINKANNLRQQQEQSRKQFVDNLYENLLIVKASEELEEKFLPKKMCSSTPTDSLVHTDSNNSTPHQDEEAKVMNMTAMGDEEGGGRQFIDDENYYQTPKKPAKKSHEVNTSAFTKINFNGEKLMETQDSIMNPELSQSQLLLMTRNITNNTSNEVIAGDDSFLNLKHLLKCKMMAMERKENLYISSPQRIIEQRQKNLTKKELSAWRCENRKPGANELNKVNGYDVDKVLAMVSPLVRQNGSRETGNAHRGDPDFQHLKMLQKIDFRFDDNDERERQEVRVDGGTGGEDTVDSPSYIDLEHKGNYRCNNPEESGIKRFLAAENEYEEQFRASKAATRLLQNYATITPKRILNQKCIYDCTQRTPSDVLAGLRNAISARSSPISATSVLSSDCSNSNSKFQPSSSSASKGFATSMSRIRKFDLTALKLKMNNVLQRNMGGTANANGKQLPEL